MGDLIELNKFREAIADQKSERDYLKEMIDNLNNLIAKFEKDYPNHASQDKK